MKLFIITALLMSNLAFARNCLDNAYSAAIEHCEKSAEGRELHKRKLNDIDGDGKEELLIACKILVGASGNSQFLLYLSNKNCFKQAGQVDGGSFKSLASKHKGLKDLMSFWKTGCVGKSGTSIVYHFDGNSYKEAKKVKCECELKPNRPSECPPWKALDK